MLLQSAFQFAVSAISPRCQFKKTLLPILLCGLFFAAAASAQSPLTAPSAPDVEQVDTAAGAEAFSVDQLGQKADKLVQAELPKAISNGLSLAAPMQAMQALVTPHGLHIQSTVDSKQQFSVTPVALSKGDGVKLSEGKVLQENNSILLQRDLLTERISSSSDGIRQDFFIHQKPTGKAVLTLDLALQGVSARQQDEGVLLTLPDGRDLVYNRLHITDATGAVLQGRLLAVNATRLQIQVDDHQAQYPILIDPTYSDADWQVVNEGLPGANNVINAAVVWNDELYVGGDFTLIGSTFANRIAKWNGTAWSALGTGMNGAVLALSVYNNELIAGGNFRTAGGVSILRIAAWNGTAWSALGAGLDSSVYALTVYNNELIAGGAFMTAGGNNASRIARWNGTAWSALGAGMDGTVRALSVYSNELIVGGIFTTAGGVSASDIATWNGTAWSALGTGINGIVRALSVYNNELIAGGHFTTAGGVSASRIARWNGTAWSALGAGMNDNVYTLSVYNNELIAGGAFTTAGGNSASYIATWNGTAWSALGAGMDSPVQALSVYNNKLIASGDFSTAGGVGSLRIAAWNGAAWVTLGTGMNGRVRALAVYNNELIAGGDFTTAGGVNASYIAKWNGTAWSALGTGMNRTVFALSVYNNELIAGGEFLTAGGVSASRIAKWNGTAWSALGAGMNDTVLALSVYNNELIAGGFFTTAGGSSASRIARWDGTAWSALGAGMDGTVRALSFYNNELIAGGSFTTAGGVSASRIATWNGTAWSALGAGMGATVHALTVYNNELIAGGEFSTAGGNKASLIARWNGTAWSALGTGMNDIVYALSVYNNELIAGGSFTTAGGVNVSHIAKWNGTAWSALGTGVTGTVHALSVYSNDLIAGGYFFTAGGKFSPYIAGIIVYTVGFDANGATSGAVPSSQTKNYDVALTLATNSGNLSRTGYSFAGWNTAADGTGTAYAAGASYIANADVTLYAQWTPDTYSLSFAANGATSGAVPSSQTKSHDVALTLASNSGNLIRTGYSFAGWNTAADGTGTAYAAGASYTANAAVTLYAQWAVSNYTLTFDTAGGSAIADASYDFGAAVTSPAAPTREGYTFTGWDPLVPSTMPASNTTLTAQWTVNAYTLTFDTAGGSSIASVNYDFGVAVTAPADPTREGYTFTGWDPLVPSTMPAANTTVTAQWTVNAYTLTFDTAGGSDIAAASYDFGAAVSTPTAPTREGYTFAGWSPAVPATMPSANTTVTAQWTVNAYTLTFDTAGGSAIADANYDFGAAVTAPAAPTREGYTFTGWTPSVPTSMPAANTTVTAQWTVNSYSITFDSAGGSAVAPVSAEFGAAVIAPTAPTRTGYTFTGWSPSLPTTMPTASTTVTAQWTVNSYTLTFDTVGGSAIEPVSYDFGASVTTPAVPTREGYTFTGWSPAVPTTMPAADTTLTAQWTVNGYTLTFDTAGGSSIASASYNFGAAVTTPTAPTREGYTFTGWSPAVPTTMPAADTTLTAQWTVNGYTLSFDSAGGSSIASANYDFGAAVATPTAPTREGYNFAGWSPTVPATMPSANTTVTAQWTVNSYTLTFDTAGGSSIASASYNFGAAVTTPTAPTREGYTFTGWSPSVPATMPSANTTLTAQWTVNSYTLTFDTAGGSAIAPVSYDFGASVTTPTAPTREGYTFTGWSPSVPATMPSANTTVTAQWAVNAYTLTFDTAGGSSIASASYDFGAAVTAPTAPTREGYTFAGWSPSVPASMPAADTTLTAQWEVNSYTLTFDTAGGSAVAPITANFGSAISAPLDPSREGYTFAGWSPAIPAIMPASNTTVTAQWTVNSYTLTFDTAGGSAVDPITAGFGSAISAPVDPSREGYTFAGWSPVIPATMPASNITVTAQWTVNSYTLTFDPAGGSAVDPVTLSFGSAVTAPAAPSREGYIFMGWEPAVPATMPAQNLTLTAQYEQIQLTVNATVTGAASISPATQLVNYGSAATFELSLTNPDDVVVLSGSCQAAVSGNQIVTSTITQDCDVTVTVHPFTTVEKDTQTALASNAASRFSFNSGAGEKLLIGATVKRAGVESELELSDAEALITLQTDGSYLFRAKRTGRYSLNFIDSVSAERVQVVYDVFPYLAFTSIQQPAQQNVATTVRVWLSDEPVEYPVTSSVVMEGVESELQQVQFTAEHKLLRSYTVTATAALARLTLQDAGLSNSLLGTPAMHTLAVQQEVPALALTVKAVQDNAETSVVTQADGLVSLSVTELNDTAATYSWSASGLALQVSGATASFDPTSVAEGRYTVTVTAQSASGRTGQYDLALRVIAECPVENCAGAGSTGIPAAQNSFAETPNRLPLCPNVSAENRVASCQTEGSDALYLEVPNQYQLTLGELAEEQSWSTGQFGGALNDASLNDAGFVQHGLIINFDVLGLERTGEVVPVALPLPADATIPANAVWRKFINGQWQNFVVNGANRIDSAARDAAGLCPGVSSDKWSSGLSVGHSCVRLTIEDGGPNDDDGVANSVIRDPGVLAVAEVVVPPPPPPEPPKEQNKSGGGMGGLVMLLLAGVAGFRMRKSAVRYVLNT